MSVFSVSCFPLVEKPTSFFGNCLFLRINWRRESAAQQPVTILVEWIKQMAGEQTNHLVASCGKSVQESQKIGTFKLSQSLTAPALPPCSKWQRLLHLLWLFQKNFHPGLVKSEICNVGPVSQTVFWAEKRWENAKGRNFAKTEGGMGGWLVGPILFFLV